MMATTGRGSDLIRRCDVHLRPDPSRVVTQLFVAGEELAAGSSRASPVMQRVLAMDDEVAEAVLADTMARFAGRHPDLAATLLDNFERVRHRLGAGEELSSAQRMLLGAYATKEYSVEAAALCNPSIVAHPDQRGAAPGGLRFVLSLRAVGEAHISSIEFRTGEVGADGTVAVDEPGDLLVTGRVDASVHHGPALRSLLGRSAGGHEVIDRIFDRLAPTFTDSELDEAIASLRGRGLVRREELDIVERLWAIASSNYTRTFPPDSTLDQRVIRPHGPPEAKGMEDARFVRFTDDDGSVTYHGTYTAFDGARISPQLISTTDFETFTVSQLTGRAATNKGMAIFPRRIDGRYVALSRWDRERIAVATSPDLLTWEDPRPVHGPERWWELIQVGNCGSPIETADGWLVLTHGVGPMRTYSLGALLLDLDDPSRVVASLPEPLLMADEAEREGYVPNVVYTCGALVHDGVLVLPYAYGDRATTFGTVRLPDLLAALH